MSLVRRIANLFRRSCVDREIARGMKSVRFRTNFSGVDIR
jgi:hypothetical protein